MLARDIMTHPVITVTASMTVTSAATLLAEHGFSAAPVVDENNSPIGIVTELDLIRNRIPPDPLRRNSIRPATAPPLPSTVEGVMTTPVESLTPGADIADVARVMVDERIRCIPIVDGYRVVGVITRRDLLRTISSDDRSISADILQRLRSIDDETDRWSVSVRHGTADVIDYRNRPSERARAEALIAGTPGLVGLHLHHEPIDPF